MPRPPFVTEYVKAIILTLAFLLPTHAMGQGTITPEERQRAIEELDQVIAHKSDYHQRRQHTTDSLQALIHQTMRSEELIHLYSELFTIYSRVQTDSALYYLKLLRKQPEYITDPQLHAEVQIGEAQIYAVAGLYTAAINKLTSINIDQLPTKTKLNYYHTCRKVYGWIADYASVSDVVRVMREKTQLYRDSIVMYEQPGIGRDIVIADGLLVQKEPIEAMQLMYQDIGNADDIFRTYAYSILAESHRQIGFIETQEYYLTLTAISDIRHGVTEYMALPQLARLLYEDGDIERAYNYIICAFEDASFCKARLRAIEASDIFPIIDKAYKKQLEQRRQVRHLFTYSLLLLALSLIIGILYLRHITHKLAASRRELARANAKLSDRNTQLSADNQSLGNSNTQLQVKNEALVQTDRVKEEYIAHYMGQCRSHIDAMGTYRRNLLKLAKANKTDEMLRALKSSISEEVQQQQLFTDFDSTFLGMHPHFVNDFNALLREEEHIYPKSENQLTPELRIFALIRLGVGNTEKIAHFLNYSPATIYSYRSRIRNASIYEKSEFDRRVMLL